MLIAMMSNSYTIISSRSDLEWKFARSRFYNLFKEKMAKRWIIRYREKLFLVILARKKIPIKTQ